MKRIENKVVIITGATRGIGRATALLFAKEGAKVVAVGRAIELGESLIEEIKSFGGEAIFVPTELTNEEELDNLVKTTLDTYGRLDVLLNNAGIAILAPLEQLEQKTWDQMLSVNLRAPYMLIKKCMPHLVASKGNILNISSQSGLQANPQGYGYNTSKFGLNGLTKVLALDYAVHGVRVNSVCPGTILTEMTLSAPADLVEACAQAIPMKRLGQPEEIANVALFMVSDEASYLTGQCIAVCGGSTL